MLGGKFSEEMERLVVLEGKFSEKNGRVGMYLKKVKKKGSSMREWKGWDILEGMFN